MTDNENDIGTEPRLSLEANPIDEWEALIDDDGRKAVAKILDQLIEAIENKAVTLKPEKVRELLILIYQRGYSVPPSMGGADLSQKYQQLLDWVKAVPTGQESTGGQVQETLAK